MSERLASPPRIRRWCPECDRFTDSKMIGPDEVCAEHKPHWRDSWADYDDEDD